MYIDFRNLINAKRKSLDTYFVSYFNSSLRPEKIQCQSQIHVCILFLLAYWKITHLIKCVETISKGMNLC